MPQSLRESKNNPSSVKWMTSLISVLLFCLPFIYIPGFGSYVALRYFVFGTVALTLGVLTTSVWMRYRWIPAQLFKQLSVYGLLVYLCAFIVVSFTGIDPALSFFSTFQRADGGFTLIFLTLFAFSVYTAVAFGGERTTYRFLKVSVFAAAIFSILTGLSAEGVVLVESGIFERSRGGATIGNSSLAAFYVVWNVFFALVLLFRAPDIRRKIGWAVVLLPMLSSSLLINWYVLFGEGAYLNIISLVGAARGAVLGVGTGFLFALGAWLATDLKKVRVYAGRALLAGMVIGLTMGGALLLQKSSAVHQKFAQVASNTRFIFWDSALAGWKERPVFGWGPNTFSELYHRHFNADILLLENTGEVLVDKPHNIFFETLAGGGLVLFSALCAFFASIIVILWRLTKRKRLLGSLLIGAFVAWLIQMQFIFDSVASLALLFLVISIGLADGSDRAGVVAGITPAPAKGDQGGQAGKKGVLALVIAISLALFIYAIVLPMRKAWVMFSVRDMTLPARADAWQSLSGISPMGDDYDSVITFARANAAYSESAQDIRSGDPVLRTIALKELDAISAYLLGLLESGGEKYELMMVAAQIHYVRLYIDPEAPIEIWESARWLMARAIEFSPTDPRPRKLLELLEKIEI